MAGEEDRSWLPEPPPPRPARRDAAIQAALRKFDGAEEIDPVRERARPHSPPLFNRRALASFATVALLAVIGIPATLIAIRDAPPPSGGVPKPAVVQHMTPQPSTSEVASPVADQPAEPAQARRGASLRRYSGPDGALAPDADSRTSDAVPAAPLPPAPPAIAAPVAMAAPAPPPPPAPAPPPQRMAEADRSAAAGNIIVTGSRIPSSAGDASVPLQSAADVDRAYSRFLARLQSAVRSGNHRAIIALIRFPLRVNSSDGPRFYANASSIERDFDKIFTSSVRRAILGQRANELFVRDHGAMVGGGEIWFDMTCRNSTCEPPGRVRIIAVKP